MLFRLDPERRRSRRGFSMIEVLVALGVIATGLLGLMSVFIAGQKANTFGQNMARATNIARQIHEVVRSQGLAFNTGTFPPTAASGLNSTTRVNFNAAPPAQFAGLVTTVEAMGEDLVDGTYDPEFFKRTIVTSRASTDPNSHLYSMLTMTVTIYWIENGVERSVRMTSLLKEGS